MSSEQLPHPGTTHDPPRRRPIPQMPAPLAPQYGVDPSHAYGPYSTAQRGRQPQSDYQMPRDASSNAASNPASNSNAASHPASNLSAALNAASNSIAASNPASNSYPRSSQVIPNSAERSVRINDTFSYRADIFPPLHQTNRSPEQHTHALSPRIPNERLPHPGTTHDSPLTTASPAFANDYSAGQPRSPQSPPSRPHVQIPPTRYSAPDSASPRLATSPATGSHRDISPAETYSPRATSPNPNIRASGSANHSPPQRYPPTLYNEPHLQRQSTTADYEQERRASTPVLPVPSRNRATAPRIVIPPADHSNRSSRPRTAITSSRTATPTDTLPVRPPSVSPSPAAFAQLIPPPQGATPRRPASPNPLPRGVSPAPLPRASSPAPLPIRSPSVRSTHIHQSTSDVSLPGSYKHYNPSQEADIAMLASPSFDNFGGPSR
jgi:hypothetical protein